MIITILKLMLFTMTLNVALVPWGTSLAKYAGYATILLTFALVILSMMRNVHDGKLSLRISKSGSRVAILLVISFWGVVSGFREGRSLNFDIILAILSFFCCYSTISMEQQVYRKDDLRDVFKINKFLAVILWSYTFLPFSFRYTEVNQWGTLGFTMGLGNPNATAIIVLTSIAVLTIECTQTNRYKEKWINLIIITMLMYTLLLLQSRAIFLCAVMLFIFAIIYKVELKKWHAKVILLIPIAFLLLHLTWGDKMQDVQFLGKAIDTERDALYEHRIGIVQQYPMKYIFGELLWHQLGNYHSAPLTILMNFGLVGSICFYSFWKIQLDELLANATKTVVQSTAILALFAFLVHSSAEAAPMMGAIPYSTALILMCRLAKDRFE